MPLHIITKKPHNYFSLEYLKFLARLVLRKRRGPQAVTASLLRGLTELNQSYFLNKDYNYIGEETVFINESVAALKYAINLKREGKIKKIIAGPNIVVAPCEHNSLILAPELDYVLVPSAWVQEWWLSLAPKLAEKLFVWPAGIEDNFYDKKSDKDNIVIYIKNSPSEVIKKALSILDKNKQKYSIIKYGHFLRKDYLKLLDSAKLLIYFQESETQGISLLEAWSKDVPTFVYNRGYYQFKNYYYRHANVAAPYLNDESGRFFSENNELELIFNDFLDNKLVFSPRQYYLNNFTDKICVQKLLNIIKY